MSKLRILLAALVAVFVSVAYTYSGMITALSAQGAAKVANPITGEGLPNPAPKVTRNWGELPAGRKWGTSAGLDIDPKDGHVWGYERCGAGTPGGGPVDCENNLVDPIFKFDRHTGKVSRTSGRVMVSRMASTWICRA
jgi:hypothetical protein